MKKIIFLFAVISFSFTSIIKADVRIVQFQVSNDYVNAGQVYVDPARGRTIKFAYSLSRSLMPTEGQTGQYEDGACTVTAVLQAGGQYINISTPLSITNNDWQSGLFQRVDIEASIGKGLPNGKIFLKLDYKNVITYSSTSYSTTDVSGGFPASLNWLVMHSYPYPNVPSTKFFPNNDVPAMTVGQDIYSPNNMYRLSLQADGNLVLYKNGAGGGPLWDSRTQGNSVKSRSLFFQRDGNLVLYQGTSMGSPSNWSSGRYSTSPTANLGTEAFYALQDDGNFVFYYNFVQIATGINWCYVLGETATNIGVSGHPGKLSP